MENITKDMINELYYDENGNETEFYNITKDILTPLLTSTIQIGGGIEVEEVRELDELFDENGIMKPEYMEGAGIQDILILYKKSRFNAFYKDFTKKNNKFLDFVYKKLGAFKTKIDKIAEPIFIAFGKYYTYSKMLILLELIKEPIEVEFNKPEGKQDRELKLSIVKIKSQMKILKAQIKNAETSVLFLASKFDKLINDRRAFYQIIGIGKSKYLKVNDELKKKYLELEKKYKKYMRNYIKLKDKITIRSIEKDKTIDAITKKLEGFEAEFISSTQKANNDGLEMLISMVIIDKSIKEKLRKKDGKTVIFYDKNAMTNDIKGVYDNLMELLKISKNFNGLFKNLLGLFDTLSISITDLSASGKQGIDDKYMNTFKSLALSSKNGVLISNNLKSTIAEMIELFTSKNLPSPDFTFQLDMLRASNKFITRYYQEVYNRLKHFLSKDNKNIILDENTVSKFILSIDKVMLGGSTDYTNNMNLFLISYDKFYINLDAFDNNNKNRLTYFRQKKNIAEDNQKLYNDFDSTRERNKEYFNINDIPGYVMITKELDYKVIDKLQHAFVSDLVRIGTARMPFICFYFNGEIFIFIYKLDRQNNTYKLLRFNTYGITPSLGNSTSGLYEIDIIGDKYNIFIPNNIYEPEYHGLTFSGSDADKKKGAAVSSLKRKLFMIPVYVKLSVLENVDANPPNEKSNVDMNNFNVYLPYDTISNKIIIPHMNIDKRQHFKLSNKTTNIQNILNDKKNNIALKGFNPGNLINLIDLKFVLFFMDTNLKINSGAGFVNMDNSIKDSIRNVYDNYFHFTQSLNNNLLDITKYNNFDINMDYYKAKSSKFKFMNDKLTVNNVKYLFANNNIEGYIKRYKVILFHLMTTLNIPMTVQGIESQVVLSRSLTNRQRQVYDAVITQKEIIEDQMAKVKDLNKKINDNEFDKILGAIGASLLNIKKHEDENINKTIMDAKFKTGAIADADSFTKTSQDNPEFLYSEKTQTLINTMKQLGSEEKLNIRFGSGKVDEQTIISVRTGIKVLPKTKLQITLQQEKGEKPATPVIRQSEALQVYQYKLTNPEGAERFVRELQSLEQKLDARSSGINLADKYPNTELTYNDLKDTYRNINEVVYKVVSYYDTFLDNTDEELMRDYRKAKRDHYQPFIESYEEEMKEEIEKAKEEAKKNKK